MRNFLLGHFVEGKILSTNLATGNVAFANGVTARVVVSSCIRLFQSLCLAIVQLTNANVFQLRLAGITVGRASIIRADIKTTDGGVIHVINNVLLAEPQPNIVKILTSDPRLSIMAKAVTG